MSPNETPTVELSATRFNVRRCTQSVLTAAVLVALSHHTSARATAQTVAGVRVRVAVTKQWTREETSWRGPQLVGPQAAIELEWRVLNSTGETLEIPSP